MRKSQLKESFLKGKWGIISLLSVAAVLIIFYGTTVLAGGGGDGTVTLHIYKYWDRVERAAVTYHPNGGTGGGHDVVSVDSSYIIKDDTANNISRVNHSFDDWNTMADGNGVSYAPGDQTAIVSGGLTLYAQWSAEIGPPTDVETYPGDRKIALLWNDPTYGGAAYFDIKIDDGEWERISTDSLVRDTDANKWYLLFKNLNNGQQYTFSIRAVTDAGLVGPVTEVQDTPDPIGDLGGEADLISMKLVTVKPDGGWQTAFGSGTETDPYMATITLPKGLANADIHRNSVACSQDSTFIMYSDSGFNNEITEFHRLGYLDGDGYWLPEVHVYFKVTSGNQVNIRYYHITVVPPP